jgi:hypothetical protein
MIPKSVLRQHMRQTMADSRLQLCRKFVGGVEKGKFALFIAILSLENFGTSFLFIGV